MYWYPKFILIACACAIIVACVYFVYPYIGFDTSSIKVKPSDKLAPVPIDNKQTEKKPTPTIPQPNSQNTVLEKKLKQIEILLKTANSELQSRRLIEKLLTNPELKVYSPLWEKVIDLLNTINHLFLFTDAPCPEKLSYKVQDGDNLWNIAKRFKTTVSLIQQANNLSDGKNIFPGQIMKIYRGKWNIQIYKSRYRLFLKDGDRIIKVYKVGIGRQNRTPNGSFIIENKMKEPAWTPPGKHIPYGHKDNILGSRWIGLVAVDKKSLLTGYGIHGTWEPEGIGQAVSNGCIRLINRNVEELYSIVPEGIPVHIHK